MSMPDEMLHSRITRYHFLSGNRTVGETFRDLFGSNPFNVGMLPKKMEVLAARLPGVTASNLDELICTNTTFPAYRPFLGISEGTEGLSTGFSFTGVARIPRRRGRSTARQNSVQPAFSRTFSNWVMRTGIARITCLVCPSVRVTVTC